MDPLREIFSLNLKTLRGDRTQAFIAEEAGIQLRTYQRIEAGSIPKKRHFVTALARVHGVKETRLFLDPSAIPERKPPTPREALEVLLKLFDKLGPDLVARLSAMEKDEIPALLDALSPGADKKGLIARLRKKENETNEGGSQSSDQ